MALLLEFVFCLEVQDYNWKQQNKFWLLMAVVVLYKCVPLKVKLMFLHIFKYVSIYSLHYIFYILYI